jgi:ABC-type nitrate/sulfonate/bicarbonate transport system permease component
MTWRPLRTVLGVLVFLLLWELLGRWSPWGYDVISTPSRIAGQFWRDADLYELHVAATIRSALLGFLIGNAVAIGAALLFCRFPSFEAMFRGVNIALFAMPPIVIGPVLVLVFAGNWPQIVLAAMVVYFPTMAAMLVGLRDIDPRLIDVVHLYGGSELSLMRFVRLRSSLPSLLAGLRIAASLAVLGAILGEFGSGVRWGLGTFLLGSLGEANPARLWGIGIAAAALAMVGYGLFDWIGARVGRSTTAVTLAAARLPDQIAGTSRGNASLRVAVLIVAFILPFVLWQVLLWVTRLSPIIAPGPLQTISYFFVGPEAASERSIMLQALAETLPIAGLGLLCGLGAAFTLAALSVVQPRLVKALLPAALVLQSTPLIAMVPIILLIFGRGVLASTFTAVLIVFFPAFVLLAQGFALVPRAARELVEVYGGGPAKQLALISIPFAARYLTAAAKLVAPRALLGVMVAEWLLSGVGLGNLLNISRGTLDYGMIWGGALVSILISVAAYQAVGAIERVTRWGVV